jgi:hypothetical protein
MREKRRKKERDSAVRAAVCKEMAQPRMSKSARIAQRNLDPARIPEHPSATMPGTVEKIISSPRPNQPEKARIAVATAGQQDRHLRIRNVLTDENGDDVKLKKGTHVEITVVADPKK